MKYDIVIDVIGCLFVFKCFVVVVRILIVDIRFVFIYVFNDGNGWVLKVLVDDGCCCYGCMMVDLVVY